MKKARMFKLFGLVLVMAFVLCVGVSSAFATDPTTSVDIYLQVGNGEPEYQYTVNPTAGPSTYLYSSKKCTGSDYYYYEAYGQSLLPIIDDVLADNTFETVYDEGDVSDIEFIGSDGYDSDDYGTVTYDDLDTGLYYPYNSSTGTSVIPILATSYRSKTNDDPWGSWSSSGCIRNFYGQQAKTDTTVEMWVKYLDEIIIKVSQ